MSATIHAGAGPSGGCATLPTGSIVGSASVDGRDRQKEQTHGRGDDSDEPPHGSSSLTLVPGGRLSGVQSTHAEPARDLRPPRTATSADQLLRGHRPPRVRRAGCDLHCRRIHRLPRHRRDRRQVPADQGMAGRDAAALISSGMPTCWAYRRSRSRATPPPPARSASTRWCSRGRSPRSCRCGVWYDDEFVRTADGWRLSRRVEIKCYDKIL